VPRKKILVISDTHLAKHFDHSKFVLLKKLILKSDKVVINGDFWESWSTNFDGFLNSRWSELFSLLLEKKTVYIFGNHDPLDKNDERTKNFSVFSGEKYDLKSGGVSFHFEHGRNLLNSRGSFGMKAYSIIIKFSEKHRLKPVFFLLDGMESCGFKLFGPSLMCGSSFARKLNGILKSDSKKTWLVCGDTHCPEIDKAKRFANSGCIIRGHCSYLLIENGKIRLKII
jgi:predicted phosphodiesterase